MQEFVYNAAAARILFGFGTRARLSEEIERLGAQRALILCTPGHAAQGDELAESLKATQCAGVFAGAVMHTPVTVTERALITQRDSGADVLVAVGGGSAIGLGKALALRTELPQIVLPTTYAGSEVTAVVGQTENGRKRTQRSPAILPKTVLYDVELTLGLPAKISAESGFNAMAHAMEALYARDANPVTSLMAVESIRRMAVALPRIAAAPADRDARSEALYAAWLAGTCLGNVGMSLHHKLCHTLGGSFNLPHAATHAALLPYTAAFNAAAAPAALGAMAQALGAQQDAATTLHTLGRSLGLAMSLRELGLPEINLARAAQEACADPYWNPRPITPAAIQALLTDAWHGAAPRSDT